MIGRTLSHYKVLAELSRGGMGIVYRALDVKLDREVALKVLPPELVADPERKRRFIQEAKAAAKLNHPHIGMVFEIDEADDVTFIAMELIRGEKLRDLLSKERLPLARSLELATEIVEGLVLAHENGIVHRDLKPSNIMVTEQGHAKIIDFGLAKLMEPLAGEGSDVETMLRRETDPGKVMGTVSYMSPEQARGKKVDHRSDIFSFGILLFETLTGHLPFEAPSGIDTLNAILNKPAPPLPALDTESIAATSALQRIVHRCLDKDPEDRYQTAKDLLSELRRVKRESDSDISTVISEAPALPAARSTKIWRIAGVAAAVILLLAIDAYFLLPEKETVIRLTNPVQITSATGLEYYPTWSPEGGRLAYMSRQSGNWDIWVTQIQGGESINLTADNQLGDWTPGWSPDGSQIAFASRREDVGLGYFLVSALGGAPRKVISTSTYPSPQWSPDGTELAGAVYDAPNYFVEIVSLLTHESRRLPLPTEINYPYDLSWSPDGRFFAYVDAVAFTAEITRIWLLRVEDGELIPVTDGLTNDWSPDWSPDGRTLFFVSNRGGSMDLWQQRITEDGSLDGPPQAVTTGVGINKAAFSADGTKLAYTRGRLMANLWQVPILSGRPATWEDAQQLTFDEALIEYVDVSADGEHLLVSSDRKGNQDLWILPGGGGEMRQLTADPTPDWRPSVSPAGQEIAFYAYRSGNRDIWVMPASGGLARQLTQHEAAEYHPSWSPDGEEIAFVSLRTGNLDIWIVPAQGGEPRQMTFDPEQDNYPRFSPDGEWVVFQSYRGGAPRLWRAPRDGGEPEPLTEGPAGFPRWSLDGKRIYFRGTRERTGNLWTLSIEDGAEYAMTDLQGRRGNLGTYGLATDGYYLYFTWEEDIGDIWVMDVGYE